MNKLNGISDGAVRKATGHGWNEWLSIIDEVGASDCDHKQIVALLRENCDLSGWWQQAIAVAYEKARGRRVVGQTADCGFQVGIQRTVAVRIDNVWSLLSSKKGIACWLGRIARFSLAEGNRYSTSEGIKGEIRVVKPKHRVRLTWQIPGMERPATLQITLVETVNERTSFRVHLEHLPSQKWRYKMRSHWQDVPSRLSELIEVPTKNAADRRT